MAKTAAEFQKEIAALKQQIAELQERKILEINAYLAQELKDNGLTLADLGLKRIVGRKVGSKVTKKFTAHFTVSGGQHHGA